MTGWQVSGWMGFFVVAVAVVATWPCFALVLWSQSRHNYYSEGIMTPQLVAVSLKLYRPYTLM